MFLLLSATQIFPFLLNIRPMNHLGPSAAAFWAHCFVVRDLKALKVWINVFYKLILYIDIYLNIVIVFSTTVVMTEGMLWCQITAQFCTLRISLISERWFSIGEVTVFRVESFMLMQYLGRPSRCHILPASKAGKQWTTLSIGVP